MPNGAENPIVEENRKTGNSYAEWGIDGIGALENQGFATDISVNHGETVQFKIKTNATQYRVERLPRQCLERGSCCCQARSDCWH